MTEKYKLSKPISCTGNRFIYINGQILDKRTTKFVEPKDDGLYYLPGMTGIFEKGITIEFALCYTYWHFHGTRVQFDHVGYVSAKENPTLNPHLVYPKHVLYGCDYDDTRIVPGFSKYIVSSDGKLIFNTETYDEKKPWLSEFDSRHQTILINDAGKQQTLSVSRIVGLAWVPYEFEDLGKQADHINEIRTDNRCENIQWLTFAYNTAKHRQYRKPDNYDKPDYCVIDLEDPDYHVEHFTTLIAVSRHLDIASSSILVHLNKVESNSVIHNRYIVWDNNLTTAPRIEACKANHYTSSKGFEVIGTNTQTGETQVFEKVSVILALFSADTGISKKTLTTSLKKENNRVFKNGWSFKYKKDST